EALARNQNIRGFGLKTMRKRAEELDGQLIIESEPGNGTKIAVSIAVTDYDSQNTDRG
ncbi:MAG: hypothetical protein GYB68_08045, partial [Chloroflexi bacterium]|nr:hypothetical protein [Chloroflexota bacterium]